MVAKGEGWERDRLGVWDWQPQVIIYRWIKKVLLYNKENYFQSPVINHNRKEY